jgi:membrane protease YdiL (CAAX protease family)
LRLELGLVLLLAFAPGILGLLILALGPEGEAEVEAQLLPSAVSILFEVFLSFTPVLVIGFLLARNREGWAGIGLTRFRPGDFAMGALLWVASFILVLVLAQLFQYFGQREVDFLPEGLPLWFRAVQAVMIALTIFGLGLMYAWYFQRTRRLWPLILAHILFDMTQLVLILAGS